MAYGHNMPMAPAMHHRQLMNFNHAYGVKPQMQTLTLEQQRQLQIQAAKQQPLAEGCLMPLNDVDMKVGKMLGFGTFGSVWEAQMMSEAPLEVALKEMLIGPHFPL